MKSSARVSLGQSPIRRASLRGVSSPVAAADCQSAPLPVSEATPYSALIDAKLEGDRHIERLNVQVRELAAQIASVEEHTRRSLAQDLHDDAGAALTAANLALARAAHWLPADAPDACADALTQARACLAEITETCHRIVAGLHEPALDCGVVAAIESWIAEFGARSGIQVDFNCLVEISLERLPPDAALALFRVMQEALGNVARHAQATRASVSLSADAQFLTLAIDDDGIGISAVARRKAGRFGLSGMRARCEALGGSLRVAAAKAGGTSVKARLPWTGESRRVFRALNG
jgi:signal transduction histidine kinase